MYIILSDMGRLELPPRARRIPRISPLGRCSMGTTSACAENTPMCHPKDLPAGNYLRVRGEYKTFTKKLSKNMELPPRARRIQPTDCVCGHMGGTTSACAENTMGGSPGFAARGNYLRVRGEYPLSSPRLQPLWELPPRARRILSGFFVALVDIGTTSACAENTLNELGLL